MFEKTLQNLTKNIMLSYIVLIDSRFQINYAVVALVINSYYDYQIMFFYLTTLLLFLTTLFLFHYYTFIRNYISNSASSLTEYYSVKY